MRGTVTIANAGAIARAIALRRIIVIARIRTLLITPATIIIATRIALVILHIIVTAANRHQHQSHPRHPHST